MSRNSPSVVSNFSGFICLWDSGREERLPRLRTKRTTRRMATVDSAERIATMGAQRATRRDNSSLLLEVEHYHAASVLAVSLDRDRVVTERPA